MPRKATDLTGRRFGMLTVIQRASPKPYTKESVWLCQCDCGNIKEITKGALVRGDTISCGCFRRKRMAEIQSQKRYPYKRLKNIWHGMIDRCENPKAKSYPIYGAKGITVCDEWKNLDVFVQWALSSGYSEELTIDRIDGDKGYSSQNCRWADTITQQNNKSNNHLLTVNGRTDTIANWSRVSGLSHNLISERKRCGWSDEQAVLTPRRSYKCRK